MTLRVRPSERMMKCGWSRGRKTNSRGLAWPCIVMHWCYDVSMRTTVDLPEDLYREAKAIAYQRSWTMSKAIAWLMRLGLGEGRPLPEIGRDELTGFPTIRIGRRITNEEVKRFLDEDE
jgi:hypothetical protein